MKVFITSDHHFFHRNIIKYCNRPFNSIEEMNEFMIKKWNEIVSPGDLVIHLGDFCLYGIDKVKKIRNQLNGIIILVKGNHDYEEMDECGFIVVKGSMQLGKLILTHRPIPLDEIPKGFTNVHGHIHDKNSFHGINVSVEKTNYKPIELKA